MELIERNTSYSIKDTTEVYNTVGSVEVDPNNLLHINLHVELNTDSSNVGNYYYNSLEGDGINVNYNVNNTNKEAFIKYVESLIEQIKQELTLQK